jgi:hypothetical protein
MRAMLESNALPHSAGSRPEMALRRVRKSVSTEYGYWISRPRRPGAGAGHECRSCFSPIHRIFRKKISVQ